MTADDRWEGSWEVELEITGPDDLLLGLVVRDLVHGETFDVELADGTTIAVDLLAGDELEDSSYRLVVTAEVEGPEFPDELSLFVHEVLEEAVEEARGLIGRGAGVGERPAAEVEMRAVPEDDERWDLVAPDWLAPDGAEVPFGFRPFGRVDHAPWPGDDLLDAHGRIILVPDGDSLRLYAIPSPADEDGSLPVLE